MMPFAETERDLATLEDLGPLVEDEEYHRATPCVRLTFVSDGNLADRNAQLDGWLARAAELVHPEVKLYGGQGAAFPASQRRKPKPSDWALFDGLSDRLAADMRKDAEESQYAIPQESGSFFFGDSLTDGHSATRFYMMGSHPWRVSLALSLPLWRQKSAEMDALVEDLAALGDVYDSGGYGFAMNLWPTSYAEEQDKLYYPISQRFRLIDMVDPQIWRDSKLDALGPGGVPVAPLPPPLLYPIMPWTLLGKAALEALEIPLQAIRDLAPEVYAVQEYEYGFLIKLWPGPVLGDVNAGTDLAPAQALGRVLAPAILAAAEGFGKRGIARIGWPENKAAWYRRFVPTRDHDPLDEVGLGGRS